MIFTKMNIVPMGPLNMASLFLALMRPKSLRESQLSLSHACTLGKPPESEFNPEKPFTVYDRAMFGTPPTPLRFVFARNMILMAQNALYRVRDRQSGKGLFYTSLVFRRAGHRAVVRGIREGT